MGPLGWRGRVCARGRGVIEHHPEDGFQGGNPLASRPHNRFECTASLETKPLFNTFCLSLPRCVLRMPPPRSASPVCRALYGAREIPLQPSPRAKEAWGLPPGKCLDSPSPNLRPRDRPGGWQRGREPWAGLACGREDYRHRAVNIEFPITPRKSSARFTPL